MKSVLLVEDDAIDASLFLDAAGSSHLADEVVIAVNVADALVKLAVSRPTAIFLDLSMPGVDGFELLRRLKSSPGLRTIPVIILSTSSISTDVRRCYELGAAAYMVKPDSLLALHIMLCAARDFWACCAITTEP